MNRSEGVPRTRIKKKGPVRAIVERDLFLSARSSSFPSFLPSFIPSFPPSFLSFFLSFCPSFLPSFLLSFFLLLSPRIVPKNKVSVGKKRCFSERERNEKRKKRKSGKMRK